MGIKEWVNEYHIKIYIFKVIFELLQPTYAEIRL